MGFLPHTACLGARLGWQCWALTWLLVAVGGTGFTPCPQLFLWPQGGFAMAHAAGFPQKPQPGAGFRKHPGARPEAPGLCGRGHGLSKHRAPVTGGVHLTESWLCWPGWGGGSDQTGACLLKIVYFGSGFALTVFLAAIRLLAFPRFEVNLLFPLKPLHLLSNVPFHTVPALHVQTLFKWLGAALGSERTGKSAATPLGIWKMRWHLGLVRHLTCVSALPRGHSGTAPAQS